GSGTGARYGHRTPLRESLARKPIRGKPLRGDSTATGTFRRSARIDGNEWQFPRAYRRYTAGVSERAYVEANCGAPRRRSGERKLMFKQACCVWDHPQKLVWSWPKGKRLSSTDRRTSRVKISDNLLALADDVIG